MNARTGDGKAHPDPSRGPLAALAAGRVAESLLFGMSSYDPRVVVSAAAVLVTVAAAAGYVPAWRASRVAVVRALRGE